jgi:hypothetical protein
VYRCYVMTEEEYNAYRLNNQERLDDIEAYTAEAVEEGPWQPMKLDENGGALHYPVPALPCPARLLLCNSRASSMQLPPACTQVLPASLPASIRSSTCLAHASTRIHTYGGLCDGRHSTCMVRKRCPPFKRPLVPPNPAHLISSFPFQRNALTNL